MGTTVEEIRVEADVRPMEQGLKRGEDRFKEFQGNVGKISSQIGTLQQIATGFGLIGVFNQVSGLIEGTTVRFQALEEAATLRSVRGRGAIQGGRAEQLAQLAFRAPRAAGLIDFATVGSTLEAVALKLGSFGATIFGAEDAANRLEGALNELGEETIKQVNQTGTLREGLKLLAEQVASNELILKNQAIGLEGRITQRGGSSADILEFRQAIVDAIRGGTVQSEFQLNTFLSSFLDQRFGSQSGVAIALD